MWRRKIQKLKVGRRLALGAALVMTVLPSAAQEAGAGVALESRLAATTSGDPVTLFARARQLTEQKRNNEALEVYQLLIASHPGIPEAHYNLGLLYLRLGQFDKAEAAFSQALRLRPGDAAAYEHLADVHVRMALRAWRTAERLDPDEPAAGAKYRALLPAVDLARGTPYELPDRRRNAGRHD